jgi:hypothetical protein
MGRGGSMIAGIHPIITFIISFVLFFGVVTTASEQESDHPLECVAESDMLVLSDWGVSTVYDVIDAEQWRELTQLAGVSTGWDLPSDTRGYKYITGNIDGNPMEVWIWHSEQANTDYMFPFIYDASFTGSDGNRYGMRPCGGWAIEAAALDEVVS